MIKFYYFKCFGFDVKSSLILPGLELSEENTSDLIISYGNVNHTKTDLHEYDLSKYTKAIRHDNGEICLLWQDIPICTIISGKKIIVNPQTGLGQNFLRSLIFGYGLAILLHQRGLFVLHANAVEMNGGAVLFLGSNGVGKSTTTITLVKNGYNLLSDDMLILNLERDNDPVVLSGLPQIKLWPEVIHKVNENPEEMFKINLNTEKRYYQNISNFSNESQPIKVIYLIEEGNETMITDIDSQSSLMALIRGSYCLGLFDRKELYENFKDCSKIAKNVPVKLLKAKHSFEDLPKLVSIIEKDVGNL